jgi:hypothetical protein
MHARPHIDARRIGMLDAKSGPPRVTFTLLALATSGLALVGAERCAWDPLALRLGLPAVAMVSFPLRRLGIGFPAIFYSLFSPG